MAIKTFDGNLILIFLDGRTKMPPKKEVKEYAKKKRYDYLSFVYAIEDYMYDCWHDSRYRSAKCCLSDDDMLFSLVKKRWGYRSLRDKVQSTKRKTAKSMASSHGYELSDIMMETGCRCGACGVGLIGGDGYELDHIMPLFLGGTNDSWNVWFLCQRCNRKKSRKDPYAWAKDNGVKLPEKFLRKKRKSA